jgi:PAS domain S-box-containing protein
MTSTVSRAPLAAGTWDSTPAPNAEPRLRILMLEDDAADADLQTRALTAAGLRCTCERVDTERAFTTSLDSGAYDLILSDYRLPSFNGLRALQILLDRKLDVPFILVSGALGEEAAIESLKLGATDYVLKHRLDRLPDVVRNALRNAHERRQRDQAEAALRESEARYRSLVENAQEIILTLSPSGTITSGNPAFEAVLGWPAGVWIDKSLSALVHPGDLAALQDHIPRVARGEAVPSFELRVRTAGGDFPVLELTATAQRRGVAVVGVLVIARDVTARRRAETRMQTLVEIAKDLTGTFELGATLARVHQRTAQAVPCDVVATFCFESEEATTRLMSHHGLRPDLVGAASELVFGPDEPFGGRVSRGDTVVIEDAASRDSPDAELFRRFGLRSAVVAPLNSHGRHYGGMVAASYSARPFDIEQIRLCEAIARQVAGAFEVADFQRAQYEETHVASALARVARELISSIDLPVLLERLCRIAAEVLEADVSYTLVRREEENVFVHVAGCGETPERWEAIRAMKIPAATVEARLAPPDLAIEEHGLRDLLPPEVRSGYELAQSVSVPLLRGDQLIGIQVAGRRRQVSFGASHSRLARGIAQLASLALENARLVGQLEQASRLKSDFLATMSHELRTPLNVILGYNDLLLDEVFGALTPEQAASLDRVGTSARELLELISATLDISRLETGRAALNLQEIDPTELLREIEAETRTVLEKPGVQSVWRIAPDLPALYSDAVKLKVLLKNLIANAAKFTDHGSVTVSAESRDGWIEFTVADTGIGMSDETQAVIFEPFRQGDSASSRRHGGVGLGLYIVTRLLELLCGRIEVDSTPGVGSTFRVWIQIDALRRFAPSQRD